MNLRNEADVALDEALKKRLEKLLEAYLENGDAVKLMTGVNHTSQTYAAAQKVLDDM